MDTINPKRTALLVMDYQNGILPMVPDFDSLLDRGVDAIATVRDADGTIAYVRVGFADGEIPKGNMGRRVGDAATTTLHADADGTQIHERVAPQPEDIVVRKTRVGPFGTTDLHQQLQDRGIDTLLIAGVSTSGCTLSAVRDAHDRDYRLLVVSDLCGDRDPEVHQFLIERVFPSQAEVVSSADLRGLLAAAG